MNGVTECRQNSLPNGKYRLGDICDYICDPGKKEKLRRFYNFKVYLLAKQHKINKDLDFKSRSRHSPSSIHSTVELRLSERLLFETPIIRTRL